MTDNPRCTNCGQKTPEHLLARGLCPGCQLDTWIPVGYQKSERYQYVEAYRHKNATKNPATGLDILDGTPVRLSQAAVPKSTNLPR